MLYRCTYNRNVTLGVTDDSLSPRSHLELGIYGDLSLDNRGFDSRSPFAPGQPEQKQRVLEKEISTIFHLSSLYSYESHICDIYHEGLTLWLDKNDDILNLGLY